MSRFGDLSADEAADPPSEHRPQVARTAPGVADPALPLGRAPSREEVPASQAVGVLECRVAACPDRECQTLEYPSNYFQEAAAAHLVPSPYNFRV